MNFTSAKYMCNPEKPDVNAVVKAEIKGEGTVYIPVGVEGNRYWVAIQAWVAEGNTIAEADQMLGFAPIAGASIADVGIVKYSLTPVYTANAPTVPNAVMVEIESFDPPDVISGSVRIDAAALLYGLYFAPAAVNTGAVDIATATFSHDYQLVGTDVDSGAVSIASPTASVSYNLVGTNVATQNPTVGSPTITSDYQIVANDVFTGNVSIASPTMLLTHVFVGVNVDSSAVDVGKARFRFEEINVPAETWTEQDRFLPVEIWTETTDTPSEIWTDAA